MICESITNNYYLFYIVRRSILHYFPSFTILDFEAQCPFECPMLNKLITVSYIFHLFLYNITFYKLHEIHSFYH